MVRERMPATPACGHQVAGETPPFSTAFTNTKIVEAGLAITLNFDRPLPQDGIDQVIVLGIKSSSDSAGAATLLEKHFDDLRFTRGIDILPQGTPTNNTERAPSGFDSSLEAAEAAGISNVEGSPAIFCKTMDHRPNES